MTTRFMAVLLAAVLAAAGVLGFNNSRPASNIPEYQTASNAVLTPVSAAEADPNSDAYLGDFKSGYADGFNAGVSGFSYPDQSSMASNSRGYLDGYSQGYTDGQGQQAALRSRLCGSAAQAAVYDQSSYYSGRTGRSRVLGERDYNDRYYYPRERVSRGIGTTARRALMIAGGAGVGAGLGGALGGRKGALIGALVGGGTGTALAISKTPSRAFNRRVTKKSVITKTLIGAGAGAAIGALAGGKRGALAGAALGGGGGALWSLMSGRRVNRR